MSSTVESRPQHEGYDPLAGGERLHNRSNSSDAEAYEASENELVALRPETTIGGIKAPMPVMPAHKIKNSSQEEQDKVAAGRTEQSTRKPSR